MRVPHETGPVEEASLSIREESDSRLEQLARSRLADRAHRIAQRAALERKIGWAPALFGLLAGVLGLAATLAIVTIMSGGLESEWTRRLFEWSAMLFFLPWVIVLFAGWIAGNWIYRCRREQRIYAQEPEIPSPEQTDP